MVSTPRKSPTSPSGDFGRRRLRTCYGTSLLNGGHPPLNKRSEDTDKPNCRKNKTVAAGSKRKTRQSARVDESNPAAATGGDERVESVVSNGRNNSVVSESKRQTRQSAKESNPPQQAAKQQPRARTDAASASRPKKRARQEACLEKKAPKKAKNSSNAHGKEDESTQMSLRPRARTAAASKPPPKKSTMIRRRASGGMSLRKQPKPNYLYEDQAPAAAGPSMNRTMPAKSVSQSYNENRRSIEVGECEACLQVYSLSYLAKHRNNIHSLMHVQRACPHCAETFSTNEERLEHIQSNHPGQPYQWSHEGCTDVTKVKAHLYACPCCNGFFSMHGLTNHLRISHNTSISAERDLVCCVCPFCMAVTPDGSKDMALYPSIQDLSQHVSTAHKGCFLLDDVKSEPSTAKRSQVYAASIKPSRRPLAMSDDDDDSDSSSSISDDSCPGDDEIHWEKLDHTGILSDYVYGDCVSTNFGTTLDSAIQAVDLQLEELDEDGDVDKEYAAEMKLYNKGLKERQQKADAERIEKERHKEECERRLLEHQYENRHKKRSAMDVEFDEFVTRRVKFSTARESGRKTSCKMGQDCVLCNPEDSTDEADDDASHIHAPSFQVKAIKELWKTAAEQAEEGSTRSRRSSVGKNTTSRSVMMLREMKHTLRFVQKYNKGYIIHDDKK